MAMWKLLLDLNVLRRFSINFFPENCVITSCYYCSRGRGHLDIKYFTTGKENKCTHIVFMLGGTADIILVPNTDGKGVR